MVIFAKVDCGPEELTVEFFLNGHHEILPWSSFAAIGPQAMTAVVEAGWSWERLRKVAQDFQSRQTRRSQAERELAKMASTAQRRKVVN